MAKRICRTADRFDPTGEPGPRCCVRRATPPSCTAVVHEISQRDKDAFIFGEGCAGLARRQTGRDHSLPPGPGRAAPPIFSDLIYDRHGREKFRFGTHYRGRGPAPPLGYATWFGQCHMFVGILAMRTIVPRTAPAVLSLEVNLWQGSQMASQLELSPRAALRRC